MPKKTNELQSNIVDSDKCPGLLSEFQYMPLLVFTFKANIFTENFLNI